MKNKRGDFLKKIIIAILSITMAFVFFGCVQREADVEVSTDVNASTTEKGSLDDFREPTEHKDETSEDVDNEATDKKDTTEVPSADKNQNETITGYKTTTGVDTTKNSKQNDDQITTNSAEATTGDKTITDVAQTTQNNDETFFTVTFKGYDGKVLKTEKVKKGEDATAPEPPEIKGFLFVKWDTYYKEVKTDITVTAVYKEITEPTLIVDTIKTNDKEVVVKVSAVNNPGLLALLLKINYDESALTLKKVESGSVMSEYTFTGPKNFKNDCNAAWSIIEAPENATDGEVAVLHFNINSQAKKGSYEISVSCYDGAFDSEYETVKFNIVNGSIIVD